ncbi:MAG TPA: type II secretion system F family protein [Phycisphaerales bacterium]|nr:type II secretion system F family protein [Phycisphaerales bacterium]
MPTFEYQALSSGGKKVAGVLAGASEQAVLAELETRRLVPVSIQEQSGPGAVLGFSKKRKVADRALGTSYTQLADLIRAGVPLLRGLKLLASRRSNPTLAAVFKDLAEGVEKGSDLGAAMSLMPTVFPPVHVAMVRAGEKGGFLEDVLERLGVLVIKQAELRSKVIGNMVYPMLLILLGAGVGVAIFGFFIPQFRPMFANLKGGLPVLTRIVFAISDLIGKYGLVTAATLAVGAFGVWRALQREDVRERLERMRTRMWVIGPLTRGFATARFCQLLGTMLANGVPMLAALKIAKDGTGNILLTRAIEKAAEEVQAGRPLAQPLAESGLLDDDVIEMIAVGESANNLDAVLLKVGESIETRLDRMLAAAVRLIEPLLLLGMAGVVGMVAAAVLIPMSKLSSSLG